MPRFWNGNSGAQILLGNMSVPLPSWETSVKFEGEAIISALPERVQPRVSSIGGQPVIFGSKPEHLD